MLVAGANARPRAIDTSHRTPVARWRFSPPPGLTFASNDVEVPLENHEGFFVIEARRGDAAQQVWLNVSRIGLVSKESAGGALVYGTDLQSGRAYAGMRISYLVGTQFAYDKTDANGISHVPQRARFALADWGRSHAFVSFLPQSPPPAALVGVRTDRANVKAGEAIRVIGFARKRSGEEYRPAAGEVALSLVARGTTLASASATLDRAGAFKGELTVPAEASSGDVAILASAAGASGGATVHVDAVGDAALVLSAPCSAACPADRPFDVTVTVRGTSVAQRKVRVQIVRSPHVLAPGTGEDVPQWGTTPISDTTVTTGERGTAHVTVPAPSDGLASTYGIVASSGAATATTQLVAPTARLALAITPEQTTLDVGDSAVFEVRAFDALSGTPAGGTTAHVTLSHGVTQQRQDVTLDSLGNGRAIFSDVALGTNIAAVSAEADGKTALDVAAVTVAPRALGAATVRRNGNVRISLDRQRFKPGGRVTVNASLDGAGGDALITIESARGVATSVVPVEGGRATAELTVPETVGGVAVGVALVRDGAVVDASAPLVVDGPGHQRAIALVADRPAYAPGATAKIHVDDGDGPTGATIAVRVSDGRAAGGASFDDVAAILASNAATTQNRASPDPNWHAWVAPARSTVGDLFGLDRATTAPPPEPTIAPAGATVLVWQVDRIDGSSLELAMPRERGRYVLAVVKVTDDGDVGSASIPVTVE